MTLNCGGRAAGVIAAQAMGPNLGLVEVTFLVNANVATNQDYSNVLWVGQDPALPTTTNRLVMTSDTSLGSSFATQSIAQVCLYPFGFMASCLPKVYIIYSKLSMGCLC